MRFDAFLAITVCTAAAAAAAEPSERMVVYLLDPRIVATTGQTMATEHAGARTDVIAMRALSRSEAQALRGLLEEELADDDNIPFCGHDPAYAVQLIRSDKTKSTVTLCGLCGTWARSGELRALHGKKSLKFLDSLLPLPDVFQGVQKLPDLSAFEDLRMTPFYLLDKAKIGAARPPLQAPEGRQGDPAR